MDLLDTNNIDDKPTKPILDTTIRTLEQNFYKKYKVSQVSIDSSDRDTLKYDLPNDFEVDLNNSYTNIEQVQLKQIQMENMFPPISKLNNKIRWKYIIKDEYYNEKGCSFYRNENVLSLITEPTDDIPSGYYGYFAKYLVEHVAEIPEGYYTVLELQNQIRNQMNLITHDKEEPFPLPNLTFKLITGLHTPGYNIIIIEFKKTYISQHKLSIYINPLTYKTAFINRFEMPKIFCIQTIMGFENDIFGKEFGQTFITNKTITPYSDSDRKENLDNPNNSDPLPDNNYIKNGIYIYVKLCDIMQQLILYTLYENDIKDSIWNKNNLTQFKNNMNSLLKSFCIPLIPSNIPDIGGISKDLINNKEYFLKPPNSYLKDKDPAVDEKFFYPNEDYQGPYFQPIDIIKIGYKNGYDLDYNALLNNLGMVGIFSSNLLRLKLVIKKETSSNVYEDVKANFNQTYFTDESTAKFFYAL